MQAEKGARQTKRQVFAKNPQPVKLVNIYFQLRNLLLIHIVASPVEIMSPVMWTKEQTQQRKHPSPGRVTSSSGGWGAGTTQTSASAVSPEGLPGALQSKLVLRGLRAQFPTNPTDFFILLKAFKTKLEPKRERFAKKYHLGILLEKINKNSKLLIKNMYCSIKQTMD